MKRLIDFDLLQWKISGIRKPLLMRGARQVGKTYAVRELGKTFANFVEINFESFPEFIKIFDQDLDPVRILNTLNAMTGQLITSGNSLLFFDEAQLCPKAILALRYFYEEMPELHVIAAGSLLDFAIEQVGVPVGRVQFYFMHPLSFAEYLIATQHSALLKIMLENNACKPLDDILHQKLFTLLGQYLILGGMPSVVAESLKSQQYTHCYILQDNIIAAYREDFSRYAKKHQIKYLETLFDYIPRNISHVFKFSHVDGQFQKRELAPALQLLEKAKLLHKVYHSACNGIPLGAESDLNKFKVLFLDIGLTQRILGNNISPWLLDPLKTFINKGALAEAFVGQELLVYETSLLMQNLYYWHRENKSSNAEVDYVISSNEHIIPVEVKSGATGTLKSLNLFLEEKKQTPFGVRFSVHPYSIMKKLHSYPLYAIAGLLVQSQEKLREKLLFLMS